MATLFAPASVLGTAVAQERDDEIDKLRAMLAAPGADGRENRERAIERLLAMPREQAHAVLWERLARRDDQDAVPLAILASLQRHVLLAPNAQFGAASGRARERIVLGYLRTLAVWWHGFAVDDVAGSADLAWQAARSVLQRLPVRDLETAARALLAAGPADLQCDVLRCLADMQQTAIAALLAEQIEATDEAVRTAARRALQLLLCTDEVRTRAQFAAWQQQNGQLRYIDLVERAARRAALPGARAEEQLAKLRVDAACEVVRAYVSRAQGIDWAAVQAKVVADEDAVLDACLELLQQALPAVPEDASPARAAFARALLQRCQQKAGDPVRRARLLEVAAYLARVEDGELAKDLVAALLAQLDTSDAFVRTAALRGLRRFPLPDVRARLVGFARGLLTTMPASREQLATALATLGSRAVPRWTAPSATDADKADWLALVTAAGRSDAAWGMREAAVALGLTLDGRDQRVPEVFDLLCELVRDVRFDVKFRSTCALHLQGWRNDPVADAWLRVQHELLRDDAPELRQQAAEALLTLADSTDSRRPDWISATIVAIRDRLPVESEAAVLRTLVECLQTCAREPTMAGKALGAVRYAFDGLGRPVAPEHQFRIEPLLQVLATVGADARADRGQWLAACPPLLEYRRRQSLRLILANHAAIDLAKDVTSSEPGVAERARKAMSYVIETGLLKAGRESWASSDELLREARDVRAAFQALETLDEKDRLDRPAHRLLRLEVEIAAGKPQDAAQRATNWLAADASKTDVLSGEERDRMRTIAAEAWLAAGRPEQAKRLLDERARDPADDVAARDLEARVAHALAATDLAGAVELLGRVVRRTPVEDTALRARVLEWMQLRLRHEPARRADTLREMERYAELFGKDCPSDLKGAWDQLRASR